MLHYRSFRDQPCPVFSDDGCVSDTQRDVKGTEEYDRGPLRRPYQPRPADGVAPSCTTSGLIDDYLDIAHHPY
ncbi:hypothetical protein M514_08672 [Trichuris suis]|uniref:Uncharacterized protein n=1 Tax=Trichuris suis TaxID=68888 RepID=A0A085MYN2_9BILA|nr:hypothetical protein M514_08672 [Trichuris suis]